MAEQYTSGRVLNIGCSYYAADRWKSRLAVVDVDWRHRIAKPSIRTYVRRKNLNDICCTSQDI